MIYVCIYVIHIAIPKQIETSNPAGIVTNYISCIEGCKKNKSYLDSVSSSRIHAYLLCETGENERRRFAGLLARSSDANPWFLMNDMMDLGSSNGVFPHLPGEGC